MESSKEILDYFLNISISDGGEIFTAFSALPGAITDSGEKPLERYVFVPGKKANAVVLVAHTDTVWDANYGNPAQTTAVYQDGIYYSTNPQCGIGADDRAGCAMLWALRDSGHSLLLVDGEEHGKFGAKYLRKSNPKLFRQLNRHQFMIELDWRGTNGCLYNQVENTQTFKNYISSNLGFQDDHKAGGCDLQILCRRVCGVNIGTGYHNYHRPAETLDLAEWENTYQKLSAFLQQEHPRFPIPPHKQIHAVLITFKGKAGRLLCRLGLKK